MCIRDRLGAQIVLANTYHLSMRPGEDTIAELGGLHKSVSYTHLDVYKRQAYS